MTPSTSRPKGGARPEGRPAKPGPARRASGAPPSPGWRLHGADAPSPATERACVIGAWLAAAALAAAILAMMLGPHRIGDYMAETDFYGAYAEGARLVQQGKLVPSRYGVIGPGYEVLLALTGFLVPNLFVAAALLSATATLATLGLWFAIVRRRLDARVALASTLLFAANAVVLRYGYSATTDAVAIAIQAGSLYLLLVRGSARAVLGAGLLAALAFLTRYNAIYLLPAGLIVILAGATGGAPPREGAAARPAGPGRAGLALRFAAGFFAPVIPWVIYSLTHGSSFSFQLHHNIAYEVFARAKGIPWDDYQQHMQSQFHNLGDVIAKDPGAVFSRMLFNVVDHLREDGQKLMGSWTAAVVAIGALIFAVDAHARRLWPVVISGALLFLTLVPAFHSERYSLALLPMYAALGGLVFGSPRFALPLGRLWVKALLIALPLVFTVQANVKLQKYLITQLPVEVLELAETLKADRRPGDAVVARKPHLAFHAGVKAAPFPFADTLPDLARQVRQSGARWLFFSWPEAETRPAFWHLLDTSGVVPGLTVRKVSSRNPAVLYEIGPEFGAIPDWFANDTLRAWHQLRARTMVFAGDAGLYTARGAIERAIGRRDDARRSLERALLLDPNRLDALIELGGVTYELRDFEATVRVLERAVRVHPNDVSARLGLGWAYFELHRDQEAAMAWEPVVTLARDPTTLQTMIRVFRSTGRLTAAQQAEAALAAFRGR